jgi:hypothetical protein
VPRRGRQPHGVIDPDHGARVCGVEGAQCDPQRRIGQQPIAERAGCALGCQDRVDAECPATRRDIREQLVHLGVRGHQRGELVDDHDEPRQRSRGLFHITSTVLGENAFSTPDLGLAGSPPHAPPRGHPGRSRSRRRAGAPRGRRRTGRP